MTMAQPSSALAICTAGPACLAHARLLFAVAVGTAVAAAMSATPAKAAAITTCGIAADLSVGDKIISNIICDGLGANTEIRFDTAGLIYDFGSTLNPPTKSGSIAYTIAVTDPVAFEFQAVGLDAGCAFPELGSCTVTKNVSWSGGSASLVAVNGVPPATYWFAPGVSALKIKDAFSAEGQTVVSVVNNSFIQRARNAPPDSVPGPVPVLGAAAAFGFSRRLRARIRTTAALA